MYGVKNKELEKLGSVLLASLMFPILETLIEGLCLNVSLKRKYGYLLTLGMTLLYQPIFMQNEQSYYEMECEIIPLGYDEFLKL